MNLLGLFKKTKKPKVIGFKIVKGGFTYTELPYQTQIMNQLNGDWSNKILIKNGSSIGKSTMSI